MRRVDFEAGIVFHGNTERIQKVLKKAEMGQPVTLAYLGGSITQGSLSSVPETCYASLTTRWWKEQYPQTAFVHVNAGIGGTPSQFGVARVEQDVLAYEPDFVIVEFSVNDDNSLFYRETYEGLVRKIYSSETNPAVLLVHNVFYQSGTNAQDQHEVIGRYYQMPCLSMKTSVYQAVAEGKIPVRDITPDDLHPNDLGHAMLSRLITSFLEKVQKEAEFAELSGAFTTVRRSEELPAPITANAYEHSVRYQNYNSTPELCGFVPDLQEQEYITDIFKRGFIGKQSGDSIRFMVPGSGVAVQYRKSVKHPACVAKAVLDGDEDHAVILDGNFDETWGDCLYITTLLCHGEDKEHLLEITITDGGGEKVPFYLVSVIGSR
ncbi:MAG: SGNH/GDSL hydrolase family protein [Lachnospiraceae bacterium]|nr:SGNH/GDSL hydrolase family protein [Lachnospiraceae bacterium]